MEALIAFLLIFVFVFGSRSGDTLDRGRFGATLILVTTIGGTLWLCRSFF